MQADVILKEPPSMVALPQGGGATGPPLVRPYLKQTNLN